MLGSMKINEPHSIKMFRMMKKPSIKKLRSKQNVEKKKIFEQTTMAVVLVNFEQFLLYC